MEITLVFNEYSTANQEKRLAFYLEELKKEETND
jgi:hypothetical protein